LRESEQLDAQPLEFFFERAEFGFGSGSFAAAADLLEMNCGGHGSMRAEEAQRAFQRVGG